MLSILFGLESTSLCIRKQMGLPGCMFVCLLILLLVFLFNLYCNMNMEIAQSVGHWPLSDQGKVYSITLKFSSLTSQTFQVPYLSFAPW